jgi:hypothetical protein
MSVRKLTIKIGEIILFLNGVGRKDVRNAE